ATMGYTGVADLAHRTEHLLDALRAGRVPATTDTVQLLFVAVDALTAAVEHAAAGTDSAGRDDALLGHLAAAAGGTTDTVAAAGAAGADAASTESGAAGSGARTVSIVVKPDAPMRGARALLA